LPLTDRQETLEHELKVAQMQADVDLKRAQVEKVRQDWRLDPTRVIISAFLAGAAIMGAAAGVLGFFIGRGH
jgi:hypothetical protein